MQCAEDFYFARHKVFVDPNNTVGQAETYCEGDTASMQPAPLCLTDGRVYVEVEFDRKQNFHRDTRIRGTVVRFYSLPDPDEDQWKGLRVGSDIEFSPLHLFLQNQPIL